MRESIDETPYEIQTPYPAEPGIWQRLSACRYRALWRYGGFLYGHYQRKVSFAARSQPRGDLGHCILTPAPAE